MVGSLAMKPEQQQALDYLRDKGTDAPATLVLGRFAKMLGKFETAVSAVDPETAVRSPAPGKWSVLEIVDHLVESNRPAVDELRLLLAGRSPDDGPIAANLQSPDPGAKPWAEHLADLKDVHAQLLALTEPVDDSLPVGDGRAAVAMVVHARNEQGEPELLEWTERLDWKAYITALGAHVWQHLGQVQRTVDSLTEGVPMSPTGGNEP